MFKTDLFLRPKTLYVFLLCLFSFAYTAKAQEQNMPKQDTIQRYKWEVATDVKWLIADGSSPFSILLRKNIITKNGKQAAWRLRIGGNYNIYSEGKETNSITPPSGPVPTSIDRDGRYSSFLIASGCEQQKQFGKFQLNYGLEGLFTWSSDKQNTTEIEFPESTIYTRFIDSNKNYNRLSFGTAGFLGAKYFIHSRWMVSTEMSLTASYSYIRNSSGSFTKREDFIIPTVSETTTSIKEFQNSFDINFLPLSVLQISYFF